MIKLTDIRGHSLYVNADLIEIVEEKPDTQVLLTSGKRFYVAESAEELRDRVIAYRRTCTGGPEIRRGGDGVTSD